MKIQILILVLYLIGCSDGAENNQEGTPDGGVDAPVAQRVLVFTKTEGYRHGSISDGVSLIRRLGRNNEFGVDRTEDSEDFNKNDLEKYDLVIFLSTTGDVLNDEQQEAFENYIRAGGSFMGIHAAADTEFDWPWYGNLVGAYFESHPSVQEATIIVEDKGHPSTSFLPDTWERRDEWYNFREMSDEIQVLLTLDEESYEGGENGEYHPIAWYREFDGGRSFYTGGGHTDASFSEPLFEEHVLGGILWCLKRTNPN
ncbi:ThuA domain-containing protein [Robertkochia flava]|uniref:ThuA domain-containing protein n=1 Tax=Robertkochia flava TaxID=3447986 RepID=UPI001CD0099D|nr:ThuA domain-containing protein [Robertkochia marina]